MNDLPDYELHGIPGESSPSTPAPGRRTGLWIAVALLMAAASAAAYIAFAWRPHSASMSAAPTSTVAAKQPPQSRGGQAEPVTLPPLDATDTLVRTLVQALSESPAIVAWLSTNGLIRNFTVVVANIADGVSPRKHLTVLRPSSAFRIVERDG